jgi:hypothetical protein
VSTRIIDGDGHVFEDHAAIAARLPSLYQDRIMHTPAWHDLFPPLDHLHQMPVDRRGMGRGSVALPEWKTFPEDIGLAKAVLYPTYALVYGMIRDRAWDRAIASDGDELFLAEVVKQIGEDAVFYSSDFPHEVTTESCLEELEEFQENEALTDSAKRKILAENAARFYGLNGG